jgi:hypothetical protein
MGSSVNGYTRPRVVLASAQQQCKTCVRGGNISDQADPWHVHLITSTWQVFTEGFVPMAEDAERSSSFDVGQVLHIGLSDKFLRTAPTSSGGADDLPFL